MTVDDGQEPTRYPTYASDPTELPAVVADALAEGTVPEVRVSTGDAVHLVTGHADCQAVLGDPRFSRNIARPEAAQLLPGVKMPSQPLADPPVHTVWRRALASAFTARRVAALRPAVNTVVDDALDQLAAAEAPADLMAHLAFPVPIAVICSLLELRPDEHAPFRDLATVALATDASTPDEKGEAFAGLGRLAGAVVQARRDEPGEDLISTVMAAAPSLGDEELVSTVMTLLIGGYENPAHQVGKMFYALFRHPEQLRAVVTDPTVQVPRAVEETLRWVGSLDSGFGSPRFATEEVAVGSTVIPAGATVLVLRQAANRDPERFEDPSTFDVDRTPMAHLTFGYGVHHCIGAALARLELEVILGRTVERFPQIALSVPVRDVPWVNRVTASGPARLPVTLG